MIASREGHTAIVQHLLEAGANKEAEDKVREWDKVIDNHTYPCWWQDGLKEEAPCGLPSPPCSWAYSTCTQAGVKHARALFKDLFPVVCFEGCQIEEERIVLFI